jgi:hypothetical protein
MRWGERFAAKQIDWVGELAGRGEKGEIFGEGWAVMRVG